jgi:hypothetical protein
MKKKNSLGRAPPRSKRSKLFDKGYIEYDFKKAGYSAITEGKARAVVKELHDMGYPAQAVYVNPFGEGGHWTVMYRRK